MKMISSSLKESGKLLSMGMLLMPVAARAEHPLITDDAGTHGQGHWQIEVKGQYDRDN